MNKEEDNIQILFVVNDFFKHGGHVKSFYSQFTALRKSLYSFHIICARQGYIELNAHNLYIEKEHFTTVPQKHLRKWQFSILLYKEIKKHMKDDMVLHLYSCECYFSALLAKTKFKKIKLINSVMGGPNPFPLLKSTDLYIAVSSEQLTFALKNINKKSESSYHEDRAIVIKNRIQVLEKNDPKRNFEKKTTKAVLIITRFDVDKLNSLRLIRKIVINIPPEIPIIFAGTGTILPRYQQMFTSFRNVEFIGYCGNLKDYVNKSLVVLGMGRSILEFMMQGVPGILVGFSGIQLLDNIDEVSFASDYNFSGRSVVNIVTPEEAANRIASLKADQQYSIAPDVKEYLEKEYSINHFAEKYYAAVKKIYPSKVKVANVFYEYLLVQYLRVVKFIRNKFKNPGYE